jgi:hypothetical protein
MDLDNGTLLILMLPGNALILPKHFVVVSLDFNVLLDMSVNWRVPFLMLVAFVLLKHKHVAEVYHHVLMDIFVMFHLTMLEVFVDQINAFAH